MNARIVLLLILSPLIFFLSCENTTNPDDIPPSVTITFPTNDSEVSETAKITCIASDNDAITKVQLYVDGQIAEGVEDNREPYELFWNTLAYDSQSVTITVKATDRSGNQADSSPLLLNVNNTALRPTKINISSIRYENGTFIIDWQPSVDDDFASYRLYESLFPDMSEQALIYTSTNVSDTSYIVENVHLNDERFYQLTVSDSLDFETSSEISPIKAIGIPLEGLIAHYSFEGHAYDVSGNQNHGIVYGADLAADRLTKANNAYQFNGVNDFIEIPNNDQFNGLPAFTLLAWIYPSEGGKQQYVFSKATPSRDIVLQVFETNVPNWHFRDGPDYNCTSTESINVNSWTHLAAVWTGTHSKIYVNGELKRTRNYAGRSPGSAGAEILIGKIGNHGFFSGKIDEVMIYNYDLSDNEISAIYDKEVQPSKINLAPIPYKDGTFIIEWSQTIDDDFASYSIYESLSSDMTGEQVIYTSTNTSDTSYIVENVNIGDRRYYQLQVTDAVGLETRSDINRAQVLGLIAHLPFEGNADDTSGYQNHGLVTGAILTEDRYSNPDNAYLFDGLHDHIQIVSVRNFENFSSFTLAAWIYPEQFPRTQYILSKANPGRDFALSLDASGVPSWHFELEERHYCVSTESVEVNSWTHVAAVWTGTHSKIYVNGQLTQTVDFTGLQPPSAGFRLQIGALGFHESFFGKIDDVMIYDYNLDDNAILELYNENN